MGVVARAPVAQGDVYLVMLDATKGSEIRKTRQCRIVSPDEINQHLRAVIVAPMTGGGDTYPWRVPCRFRRKSGFVVVDQIGTVDRSRLTRRMGRLRAETVEAVLRTPQEMFADPGSVAGRGSMIQ